MRLLISILSVIFCSTLLSAQQTKDLKITVFGSSTVWGNGLLGERSMAGVIDEYLRNSWSKTVYPGEMKYSSAPETVKNRKFFRGSAAKISGKGAFVEFSTAGDKLVICQAIARTNNFGEMTVYADGKKIGSFTNKNPVFGKEEKTFDADGKKTMFPLGRHATYAHKITVDGREMKFKLYDLPYVTGDVSKYFKGFDGIIVRGRLKENVEHFACFFKAPKGKVNISYSYGNTVSYTYCTVGGLAEDENTLESPFGVGNIPYDLANPTKFSTGLDFRYSNPQSMVEFKFADAAERRIRIEITGGKEPYFMINFASNRNHRIMNAGIGGFTAEKFLKDKSGRRVTDALKLMVPDAAFIILGGNDDWYEMERLVCREEKGLTEKQLSELHSMFYRSITEEKDGTFTAVRNSGIIDEITPTSLVSGHLKGAKIPVGSYVRIGNYYGDNRSTVVRRVAAFDDKTNTITWKTPIDPGTVTGISEISGLKHAEFTVRTLSFYKSNIEKMIKILRKANPEMKIILLNTYTPNYFCREVWAYAEALEDVAKKYSDVIAADSSPDIYKWITTQFAGTRRKATITSTGKACYDIPKIGHWQGFQIFVDGKDVYGKDCRVESGLFYAPAKLSDGTWKTHRTSKTVRRRLRLVFTSNIPPAGTKIHVKMADKVWSNDYAHPTPDGCVIIGNTAYRALKTFFD